MRLALLFAATAGMLVLAAPDGARAADPNGTWVTEGGKSRVRIANCGGAICVTIVALQELNDPATGRPKTDKNNADANQRNRPMIGVQIVLGMRPNGADRWSGQVYNAEDGKTYSGNVTMTGANTPKLEGCALGGLVCKSQTWTRAN